MKEEKYWGEIPNKDRVKPSKKRGGEGDYKHIAVIENKIYFYAGVNRDSAVELNKKVGELQSKSFSLANNLDIEPPYVHLFINSGGGSITSGISSMDTILRCKVPVHTYVDGFCASAGTFISVVGSKRYMSKNSYMLIHQLSSQLWGKYSEIKNVYRDYTKVPTEKLDEILKHDLMWDAKTCLKYGMIDEIV